MQSCCKIKAMAPLCVCTEVCHMYKNKGKCYFNHKLEGGNKENLKCHLRCFKRLRNEVPSTLVYPPSSANGELLLEAQNGG